PPAFQCPDIAAARVTMGPATSATPSFRATPWTLAARFETSDGTDGSVEVAYLEERPASHSGPFLAEEVDLLQSLADMLRSHVERRRAEDARRASEAMLRTASRMARLGAWTIERPARHVVWSSELREILEGGDGAVPTLDEGLALYAPEYRDAVTAAVRAALAEGTPFDLEVAIDTLRGRRLWVRVSGEAERDAEGQVIRLRGALQDLTDRKNLEQQFLRSQRIESIGTLAGGIAHDLNNVLAPIVLSAEMLRTSVDDPFAIELITAIETSARRGADMVRQVLAFARGVEGQRVPVPLDQLVREIERIANDTFLKSIQVRTDVPPDLPPVVGDRTQLHQVLLNLCVNARDAMPEGGVLSISAKPVIVHAADSGRHPDARPGSYVMVQVEDTGAGMAPSTLDRIFEPFFTTKEPGKGTGLGLPTSLAIVRSHQGFIDVDSTPGRGTALPCLPAGVGHARAAALAHPRPAAARPGPAHPRRGRRRSRARHDRADAGGIRVSHRPGRGRRRGGPDLHE
ncbi:MAG: two-component system sensor histidine kinase NtrB, partial [Vicinamibacteria bacterium]